MRRPDAGEAADLEWERMSQMGPGWSAEDELLNHPGPAAP
jgi:hypothetical protein